MIQSIATFVGCKAVFAFSMRVFTGGQGSSWMKETRRAKWKGVVSQPLVERGEHWKCNGKYNAPSLAGHFGRILWIWMGPNTIQCLLSRLGLELRKFSGQHQHV